VGQIIQILIEIIDMRCSILRYNLSKKCFPMAFSQMSIQPYQMQMITSSWKSIIISLSSYLLRSILYSSKVLLTKASSRIIDYSYLQPKQIRPSKDHMKSQRNLWIKSIKGLRLKDIFSYTYKMYSKIDKTNWIDFKWSWEFNVSIT